MPRHITQLGLVILGESSLVFGLHRTSQSFPIDWPNLWSWLRLTALETSVPALVRLVALLLAYWLLLSTLTYTTALLTKIPTAIRAVEWMTLPSVQRLSQKAVRVSLAASLVAPASLPLAAGAIEAGPAFSGNDVVVIDDGVIIPPGASVPEAPDTPPADEEDRPNQTPPAYVPTPSGTSEAPNPAGEAESRIDRGHMNDVTAMRLAAMAGSFTQSLDGASYTVRRGDNLWDIAAAHLAEATGRVDLTDAEIAPFWGQIVEENRNKIASNNPDMISPGEVITLPSIGAS